MRVDDEDHKKAVIRTLLDDHSRLILLSSMLVPKSVVDITPRAQYSNDIRL